MAEAMTEEKRAMKESAEAAKRGVGQAVEGEPTKAIWEAEKMTPSSVYMYAAGASILASSILFLRKNRDLALFIGQWAPTFLITGLFFKLLSPKGKDAQEQP